MPRRRVQPQNTAERTIQFFRVDTGQDDAGQPNVFDHAGFLELIDQLPWTPAGSSRYMRDTNESDVCAHIDGGDCLRLSRVRRSGLPQIEDAGAISPLTIGPDQGLLETIHVVWFPNHIVGADYNHYGPRLSRLSHYIEAKFALTPDQHVYFHPLLKQDALNDLSHLRNLTLFRMKIRAPYAAILEQGNNQLSSMFESAGDAIGDAGAEIEIIIRPSADEQRNVLQRLIDPVRELVQRRDFHSGVRQLQIAGKHDETNRIDVVDLLNDRLISRKSILREEGRSRAISAASAYDAIRGAHAELREELEAASEAVTRDTNQDQ